MMSKAEINIKIFYGSDIRRTFMSGYQNFNYEALVDVVGKAFENIFYPDQHYMKYLDEENDWITLSNNSDVAIALSAASNPLRIKLINKQKEVANSEIEQCTNQNIPEQITNNCVADYLHEKPKADQLSNEITQNQINVPKIENVSPINPNNYTEHCRHPNDKSLSYSSNSQVATNDTSFKHSPHFQRPNQCSPEIHQHSSQPPLNTSNPNMMGYHPMNNINAWYLNNEQSYATHPGKCEQLSQMNSSLQFNITPPFSDMGAPPCQYNSPTNSSNLQSTQGYMMQSQNANNQYEALDNFSVMKTHYHNQQM